jgi:hypothetical protein
MRTIKITSLLKGDWIVVGSGSFLNKSGKNEIGRVKGFSVKVDKIIKIDMDKKTSKENGEGWIDFIAKNTIINKLSKKDLKDVRIIEKKIKILRGLDKMNEGRGE